MSKSSFPPSIFISPHVCFLLFSSIPILSFFSSSSSFSSFSSSSSVLRQAVVIFFSYRYWNDVKNIYLFFPTKEHILPNLIYMSINLFLLHFSIVFHYCIFIVCFPTFIFSCIFFSFFISWHPSIFFYLLVLFIFIIHFFLIVILTFHTYSTFFSCFFLLPLLVFLWFSLSPLLPSCLLFLSSLLSLPLRFPLTSDRTPSLPSLFSLFPFLFPSP